MNYKLNIIKIQFLSPTCCSVTKSSPPLCDPMDCSTPGFPVYLPELAQTHVHWVGDAIQPPHPLLSPSPPAFILFQHQGLFQGSFPGSLHQVAKVLEFQLQHQSFQWIFRTDFLSDWLLWSPCSPRDSEESSPTSYTVQKHQLFGAHLSLCSNSPIHAWLLEKP